MTCSESLVSLSISGLSKNDVTSFEQDLDDDDREWTLSLAAGCFLQHMALVMKDAVINPVLEFVQPKMSSNNPVDKYIGMMAFGAIIDGPDPTAFGNIIQEALPGILNLIIDDAPKVSYSVAWVYYKLAENMPILILQDQAVLDIFINNSLNCLNKHSKIALLLLNGLKELFINASKLNAAHLLNNHFNAIFSKVLECMYRADIIAKNMQGIVSTVINDITEKCDSDSLKEPLKQILVGVLQELANSMNNDFILALNPEQKEDF
jgi:importin subunit beta-1